MYLQQYNDAQLKGQGQVFKEVFATGSVMTKEAAMTASLTGKAATETINQATATAAGNAEAAKEASSRAWAETEKNNKI